jgi:beta-N-acetylhexosaminidase
MSAVPPGRLAMVDIPGRVLDDATAAFLSHHRVRAVCLFRRNLHNEHQTRQLVADLRAVMGDEALIALDQEGGSVVRATFLPQPPSAMALGAADDEALAERVGAAVARGLASLGINWNFAPVLDVNNNPANPVIAERSFSQDPDAVVRLAGAWMRGAAGAGVACCVKHFPGHGDTHVDSHHALPVVDKPRAALDALELYPFRALCHAAPAVMTAHIVYPQLDAERPATLSPVVLGGILRGEWGYDGVVITDALMMKAIHERYGHARAAVMAVRAGADMVLAQGTPAEQAAAIEALGALPPALLERANARLDRLARRHPGAVRPYGAAARADDERLMHGAWAAGLTALRGARPPALDRPVRVLTQRLVPGDGVSEAGPSGAQVAALFEGFADVSLLQVDDLAQADPAWLPDDGRLNVLASNHRLRYAAPALRPDLHLVLWNPFQALDCPVPTVLAWGHADGALAALQRWLQGTAPAPGRAPVMLDAAG